MQTTPTSATRVEPPDLAAAQLPQTVSECHAVIGQLMERVKLLEERVNLDSNNSSKPPSSNGPGSPNRSQRRVSQRKRGAQAGHKGHARAMLDESEVDRLVDCKPQDYCECGSQVVLAGAPQRHQVFEVPPMRAQVDEYRLYSGRCAGCGKAHAGVLPAGVPKGQLGPRALSLVGVLGTRYHLTQRKIRNLLDQLMGLSFSVGAISQAHGKVAGALKSPVAQAVDSMRQADTLWMDETHYPREGISNWVWAAVQPLLAVFAIYPSRARYVILDFIGEQCTAVVTSDRYAGYAFIDPERRQVCWAHLLRDFNRIAQRSGLAGRVGQRLLGLGWVMLPQAPQRAACQPRAARAAASGPRGAAAWRAARRVHAHGQDLRQHPQAVAGTVDLHDPRRCGAHQQRGRAGAAQPRAQAQDLRAHALAARRPVPGSRLQRS